MRISFDGLAITRKHDTYTIPRYRVSSITTAKSGIPGLGLTDPLSVLVIYAGRQALEFQDRSHSNREDRPCVDA